MSARIYFIVHGFFCDIEVRLLELWTWHFNQIFWYFLKQTKILQQIIDSEKSFGGVWDRLCRGGIFEYFHFSFLYERWTISLCRNLICRILLNFWANVGIRKTKVKFQPEIFVQKWWQNSWNSLRTGKGSKLILSVMNVADRRVKFSS